MVNQGFPANSYGHVRTPLEEPNEILALAPATSLPGGVLFAPTLTREVRVGEILAQDSVSKFYLPRKSTEANGLSASGQNLLTVDDAHMFEVGDTLSFGGTAADNDVVSINYETNVITLAANLSANVADRERVFVDSNGVGTAVGIASVRWTPRPEVAIEAGKGAMYIAGTFKKWRLHGSADGVDTQANTDLGGVTIQAPEGALYRIA